VAVPDVTCLRCRQDNPARSRFCNACGAALTPAAAGEALLSTRTALEGERKQVTVLFADLQDSMAMLAGRDPEDARKILDPLLDRMMEAVHRYEGTVNQVMGDGIMALFGAPLAHEDHAVRACYAGLRMLESVNRYSATVRADQGLDLHIRVGLHSGEVVVRSISNDLHVDYTAVGETTHLAARMEQTAAPGTIRVTAETLRLVEGYVQHRALGRITVKGLRTPVAIYEITGVPPAPSRMHPVAARGLTRFVGREGELQRLEEALALAGTGRGQIAAVVGEPGVGKSRVCSELVSSAEARGWRALRSGAVSYGKTTPYLPVRRLLETHVGLDRQRGPEELAGEVTARLTALDVADEGVRPAILALLGLPGAGTAWEALDPPRRRERTLDAVRQVLTRASEVGPLLVLLEDLQWIDGETQAVLERLVEHLPGLRMLLLVNFRPEYAHGWAGADFFREIRMESLPAEAAQDFLEHLLGGDPSLRPLKAMLVERTEGNPFFLEESVKNLVEAGSLTGVPGDYRVAKPIDGVVIAPSVQAVLAARIDRLAPSQKRVLQAAAVIGKDLRLPWLRGIADDPDEVDHHVAALRAADFIHEVPGPIEPLYTFKHALTHEVAYTGILNDRKRVLHGKVVDVIEALHGRRLHEHADHLAHHALSAERWDKAIDHLRAAAAGAYASGAVTECLARYEHALALLEHLGPGLEDRRRAIDLHLDAYGPLFFLGQFERIAALSRRAAEWADVVGDRHRLGRAAVRLAAAAGARGEYRVAIDHARQALQVAEAVADRELRIAAAHLLGVCHEAQGDYPDAMRFLGSVVDGPDAELARQRLGLVLPPYIFDAGWMALALAAIGEFRRAREYSRRAVSAAEENDHPAAQTFAYALHATALGMHGQFSQASSWAERAVELGEAHQVFAFLATAYSTKGWLDAWLGRCRDGLEYLERSVGFLAAVGLRMHAGSFHVRLAEGLVLAGEIARAREAAERALALGEAMGERGSEAEALRLLGDVHRMAGDLAAAEPFYQRSRVLATTLGMRPLVAHDHAGLARLYQRRGDAARAQEHVSAAAAMYRDLQMRYWLETLTADIDGARPHRAG
jgi:class 3 adenylate cyclase/tetratricopeptide (TPR) repeat protein